MSIRISSAETDTCDDPGCDERYIAPNGVDGHCSQDCADRHRGRKLLRNVRTDHRWCWSCWKPKKTIEKPSEQYRNRAFDESGVELTQDGDGELFVQRYGQEDTRDAVCGFEHYTRHVTRGPYGIECECAAISHDIDEWDRRDEGVPAWRLKRIVDQMRREGQHDHHFDPEAFANTLWRGRRVPPTWDHIVPLPEWSDAVLELAVGRALT
jgi:hypothetical protein